MPASVYKVKIWIDFNLIEGANTRINVVCELPVTVKSDKIGENWVIFLVKEKISIILPQKCILIRVRWGALIWVHPSNIPADIYVLLVLRKLHVFEH